MKRDWLEDIILKALSKEYPNIEEIPESSERISEAINNTFPKIVKILEKDLLKNYSKILRINKRGISKFKKRLKRRWQLPFELLEFFIYLNLEFGEIVCNSIRNKKVENIKFETLFRLHARAIQIALEILELLKGGFADGAMARWRTLYEISIVSNFLSNYSEEVSQRYLDYYFVENYNEMLEYQKNYEKLGYEPLSQEERKEIEDIFQLQKQKYGEDFVRPYGWVGDLLPKSDWNFKGIERTINFNFFRSFYKMANNYVHSSAKGFLFKLGEYNINEIMLAGPSNYGFADPGQNTAISVLHTTLPLTEFEIYLENNMFIQLCMNILNRISEEFVKIQKQIEAEE